MKNEKKVKVKKKLRIKVVLIILLVLYLIGTFIYSILNSPVDKILISGNEFTSDNEIIEKANLESSPKIIMVSSSKIEKSISELPLIKEVEVKKSLFGTITIEVVENKILFYNSTDKEIVLENQTTVEYTSDYLGVPTLVNYVPSDIYESLISELSKIDQTLINKISEIEYAPNIKDDITLDAERFIFKMNDTNTVHVNLVNFDKFNKYNEFCEVQDKRGTLYLDSSNDNHIFDYYE